MEGAFEAFLIGADRCPCCRMVDICTQEELEVLAALDTLIQRIMSFQITRCCWSCQQAQVVQVLEQVKTIL